mmetsp:Transcript_14184/g.23493  ORF Transcript_14184/g.23493 Transcript_14184/m.23493 type:complete len:213 (+) Transcript_14184:49-687(+)
MMCQFTGATSSPTLLTMLLLVCLVPSIAREQCPLMIMIPSGDDRLVNGNIGNYTGQVFTQENVAKEGYSLLAGALLAIEHFNNRDGSIVPELQDLQDCQVFFREDNLILIDSFRNSDEALEPLILSDRHPCAIVGPEDSQAAQFVGSAATVLDITSITYGGMDEVLTNPTVYPQMARGTSTIRTFVQPLVQYLLTREYVSVLEGGATMRRVL